MVAVGSALLDIDTGDAPAASDSNMSPPPEPEPLSIPSAAAEAPAAAAAATATAAPMRDGPVLTTPAVRKIAKENNLDLNTVPGTGE